MTELAPREGEWERAAPATGARRLARGGPPASFASIIAQMPFFKKGTPEQRRRYYDVVSEARRRSRERKSRVAAHPDLAERMAVAMGLSNFGRWNGYVPAARDEDGVPNRSPVRAAAIEILREVVQRETAVNGALSGEDLAEWE